MESEANKLSEAIQKCDGSQNSVVWLCALMSNIAYLPENEIKHVLSNVGEVKEYIISRSKRNQLVCIKFGNYLVVAFKGTVGFRGWVSNLDLRGVKFGDGYTHYGFTRAAWDFLEDKVMLQIIAWSESQQLIWCGHSRGGAIANISAALMTTWHVKSKYVISFGCPKYGDDKFHDWVRANMKETKLIRVVNRSDIVPSLPPSNWQEWKSLLQLILILPFFWLSKTILRKKE